MRSTILKTTSAVLLVLLVMLCNHVFAFKIDSLKQYKIYVFEIKEEIAPPVLRRTQIAFREARENKSDIIIVHMNTYGGQLDAADSIRSIIMYSDIPVVVFIDNNAASAGALISIACDSIYMRSGASIGAATVVNQNGEPMPDKYQSYMRSLMRSTAQASGRDPQIAQAMVDPSIKINGITDTNKILTFTSAEAMQYGYCEGEASSIKEVIQLLGIKEYTIVEQELSALDKLISFLISPVVSGILIMMIIGGIYFEVQAPGIGLPLGIAVTGAVLYFAPLYLEGLAANWEILLFIGGLALIALEIFVIPGFGVTGVSGIVLVLAGLVLSMLNNSGFDFTFTSSEDILTAFSVVIIAIFMTVISGVYFSQKLLSSNRFAALSLMDQQKSSEGFTVINDKTKLLLHKEGVALTILRPSGNVDIEGVMYQATAQTGYIEKGERVKVIGLIHNQVVVEQVST